MSRRYFCLEEWGNLRLYGFNSKTGKINLVVFDLEGKPCMKNNFSMLTFYSAVDLLSISTVLCIVRLADCSYLTFYLNWNSRYDKSEKMSQYCNLDV